MEQIIRILIKRLVGKGMEVTSIPAYIRDLANIIADKVSMSLEDLNSRLQLLGWNDFELDDHTLQLIIATFDLDFAYKPPHYFDRTFKPKRLHKLADKEESVPAFQIEQNKPLQE